MKDMTKDTFFKGKWKEIDTEAKNGELILAVNEDWLDWMTPRVVYHGYVSSFWGGKIKSVWIEYSTGKPIKYFGIYESPTHYLKGN